MLGDGQQLLSKDTDCMFRKQEKREGCQDRRGNTEDGKDEESLSDRQKPVDKTSWLPPALNRLMLREKERRKEWEGELYHHS